MERSRSDAFRARLCELLEATLQRDLGGAPRWDDPILTWQRAEIEPFVEADLLPRLEDALARSLRRGPGERPGAAEQVGAALTDLAALLQHLAGDDASAPPAGPRREVHLHWATAEHYHAETPPSSAKAESTSVRRRDRFIHRDLGTSLTRRLDAFLEQEVLDLDALEDDPDRALAALERARVVRALGRRILEWFARFEEVRRRLLLKRPFVLRTRWIVSPPPAAAHDDTVTLVEPPTTTPATVYRRLGDPIEGIAAATEGILLFGHNLRALALMQRRLAGQVEGVYLDPPYNTGERGFAYRDGYRHAAWLSMMQQVLRPLGRLASGRAFLAISINESELFHLELLCRALLGEASYTGLFSVRVRHEDRILKGAKEIHEVLEYVLLHRLGPDAHTAGRPGAATEGLEAYTWRVTPVEAPLRVETLGGKRVEVFAPGTYILGRARPGPKGLKRINIRGTLRKGNSSGRFYVTHIEPRLERYQGHLLKVEGMGADDLGYRWFWIPPAGHRRKNPDYFQGVPTGRFVTRRVPFPNLLDFETHFNRVAREGGVTFRDGKKPLAFLDHLLTVMGLHERREGYVVDLFGGSGSTAHAVLRLNTRDRGHRTFVLAEMAEYTETVTLPRLLEAATEARAQRGASDHRPLLIQILDLESYDDTLENLEISDPIDSEPSPVRPSRSPSRQAPDVITYRLDDEGRPHLSPSVFRRPWQTVLRLRRDGRAQSPPVDLVETFNALLGLRVHQAILLDDEGTALMITGADPDDRNLLILWRTCERWPEERLATALACILPGLGPGPFACLYVNGPGPLSALEAASPCPVHPIEPTFAALMFDPAGLE